MLSSARSPTTSPPPESLFLRDAGRPPARRSDAASQRRTRWRDDVLFHEYFDGDTGRGLGASHQTGWTALVAKLLDQRARRRRGVSGAGTVATAGGGVLDRSP